MKKLNITVTLNITVPVPEDIKIGQNEAVVHDISHQVTARLMQIVQLDCPDFQHVEQPTGDWDVAVVKDFQVPEGVISRVPASEPSDTVPFRPHLH